MIDPNWLVVDLDPHTWRNLGRFFDPPAYVRAAQPGERGLFVLHDNGRVQRVFDNEVGVRRDLALRNVDDPRQLAQRLYDQGEWQRVHIIDKRHLAEVARCAQETPQRELTLDAYYHRVYQLIWGSENGYVSLPPHPGHWHGWTYSDIKEFAGCLPEKASLALAVLDKDTLEIGVIVQFEQGLIRCVTTFEALDLRSGDLDVSAASLEEVWWRLGNQFAPPAGVLLCTPVVFEEWITAVDKDAVLQQADEQGLAFWRSKT